ncbi:hypothetical protein BpHYR1_024109, partial [Brachionus plicatilis]
LNHNILASLYKALICSILDYNFPCLNLFFESGLQKLQVIQNTAVRCILKLLLRTSSESLFYEAENKLNINLFRSIKEPSILDLLRIPLIYERMLEQKTNKIKNNNNYLIHLCPISLRLWWMLEKKKKKISSQVCGLFDFDSETIEGCYANRA